MPCWQSNKIQNRCELQWGDTGYLYSLLILYKAISDKQWYDYLEAVFDLINVLKKEIVRVVHWIVSLYKNKTAR